MDKNTKDSLQAAGLDTADALERMMGNEALLIRLLKKFPADPSYDQLRAAVANGDTEAALKASHTLKGVCGNMAMTTLYDLTTRQVALFRAGDNVVAFSMMPEITSAYEAMKAAIDALP